jgi:hypothetical protein
MIRDFLQGWMDRFAAWVRRLCKGSDADTGKVTS